jgi:uncharacterized protein (DUF427 family)
MRIPKRIEPGPGQESVWDYPRPPLVEASQKHIQVLFNGEVVADTRRAKRVLETAGAPVYYIPPEDVRRDLLTPSVGRGSLCEWKGQASYVDLIVGEKRISRAAWFYPNPTRGYEAIKDHLAFYPLKMDACTVDGEVVRPQPGGFYGGWVTDDIVGPIKGEPGTEWW